LPSPRSTHVRPWRLQLNMLSSSNCPFRTVSHSLFIVATCRPHLSAPSPPPRRHHFPPLPAVPATPLGTGRCCLCALTLPHPQNPSFTPLNPAPTNNGVKAITPPITTHCRLSQTLLQLLYTVSTTPRHHRSSLPLSRVPSLALALVGREACTAVFRRLFTAVCAPMSTPLAPPHRPCSPRPMPASSSAHAPQRPVSVLPAGPTWTRPRHRSIALWTLSTGFPVEEKFYKSRESYTEPLNLL
jgi:hypothetical protein